MPANPQSRWQSRILERGWEEKLMFQVRKMGALIAAALVVVSGCLSPGARGSSGATPPLALDVLAAKLTAGGWDATLIEPSRGWTGEAT